MSETVGLHTELTADSSGFTKQMEYAYKGLAKFRNETSSLKAEETALQDNLSKLTGTVTKQTKTLAQSKQKLDEVEKSGKGNSKTAENLRTKIDELEKSISKTSSRCGEYQSRLRENSDTQSLLAAKAAEATNTINQQTQAFQKNANEAKNVTSATGQIKNGLMMLKGLALGYAGKTLYSALIGTNADFEQSMVSFEVLLQSADKAQNMMEQLNDFGAKTPFELPDVTNATKQLLAFGVAEEDIMQRLQQLGDLSQGKADILERITLAYGKMLAKGKVSLEELNMMTEAGIPILKQLSTQMGITTDVLLSMITNGEIGVEDINKAMQAMTSEGGQFFGMMEKQSKTLEGMFSTLSDNATAFARDVGNEAFNYLKTEMEGLLDTINQMDENGELKAVASEIGENTANTVVFFGNLIKTLWELRGVIEAGAKTWITYKSVMISVSVIKKIVDAYKDLKSGITAIGSAQELMNILTGKSIILKNTETGAITVHSAATAKDMLATQGAKVAQIGLNTAILAFPWTWIALGLGAIVGGITLYNNAAEKAKTKTDELKESYQSNLNSGLANVQLAKDLTAELEKLQNQTSLNSDEKERMKGLVEQLNSLLPDLNLNIDENTGKLDGNTKSIQDNIAAYEAKIKADAKQEYLKNLITQIEETKAKIRTLSEEYSKLVANMNLFNPFNPLKNNTFNTVDYIKINKELADMNGELVSLEKEYKIAFEESIPKIKKNILVLEELTSATKDVKGESKNLADKLSDIETITEKVNKGYSFSYEEINALKEKYPELESAIYRTEKGWGIEKTAVDRLRQSSIDLSRDHLQSQITMTQNSLINSSERMKAIKNEILSIKSLADAYKIAAGLGSKFGENYAGTLLPTTFNSSNNYDEYVNSMISQGKDPTQFMTEDEFESLKKDTSNLVEYGKLIDGFDEATKELNDIGNGLILGGAQDKPSKGSGSKSDEDAAFKAEKHELDYQHGIRTISDEDYFNQLSALNDKHHTTDSDLWKDTNLTVHKGNEDAKKKRETDAKAVEEEEKRKRKERVDKFTGFIDEMETEDADWESEQSKIEYTDNDKLFATKNKMFRYKDRALLTKKAVAMSEEEKAQREILYNAMSEEEKANWKNFNNDLTGEESEKLSKQYNKKADSLWRDTRVIKKEIFYDELQKSEDYITDRNDSDDWEEKFDTEIEARNRIIEKLEKARDEGIITVSDYHKAIDEQEHKIHQIESKNTDDFLKSETDRLKKKYDEELSLRKASLENEKAITLKYYDDMKESAKNAADAEIKAIDEVLKKRKEEKEDNADNLDLQRMTYKYNYETDFDNKENIKKEIDKLKENIADKNFERDMQDKKDKIKEDNDLQLKQIEETEKEALASWDRQISKITVEYQRKMSDVNIANELYKSLDIEGLENLGMTIGDTMGTAMSKSISTILGSFFEGLNLMVGIDGRNSNMNPIEGMKNYYKTYNYTNNFMGSSIVGTQKEINDAAKANNAIINMEAET